MADTFPQQAIDFLGGCRPEPGSAVCYEMASGSLNWEDEHYLAFAALCKSLGCEGYAAPFAFRTSLIEGRPREEFRAAWDELRRRCPDWIGFRPERVTPSPELQAYLRRMQDDF